MSDAIKCDRCGGLEVKAHEFHISKEVEWVWTGVENIWKCPLCEALREVGHQPGCKVGSVPKECG